MATVNERFQSASISHAIDLQHFSNAEVRKIMALLNRVDEDLRARLLAAIGRMEVDRFTVKHMNAVLAAVLELNKHVYEQAGETLKESVDELASYEIGYQQALFTATLPAQVLTVVPLVKVDLAQVRQIASSRPFQGKLLGEWMADLEAGRAARIRDAIRIGMVEGLTADQIVRRIMGIRSEGYADGLLNRSRSDIEAMVRTAISHTAQSARDAFYQANSDLISGVVWLSTLDGRTSAPCRLRDGLRYSADTHRPIGHQVPWLSGPGRLHWCCRSSSTPIIKAWEELGLSKADIPEGTRASMDGQIPESTSYGDWIKGQSAARQNQVLGPTRGKLMREGGLTLDRFYNDRGRLLTLDQLREQDASAFDRAGL
ncbi:hypothetical protein AL532_17840 [Pseudomonas monteilii]|jgi:hypothetical protein|uniref:hypothetical protein n=1 Tax=Pseudomonas monteilii TaxID=76759 RepID=UPI000CEB7A6D|nr:hypothetical protein [Pseudomonas monteilii]CAB5577224.1 Uncharacterised protein [Pseudomonas putida]AVH38068.1 hypothetical protein AL532_17840 [Pseudomonas monteilii]CAB5578197.1 Uncharacterised protein [Pseudomonas putida]CAB5621560.1 Uncharacterised protein [Pseudomonas putida]CAB5623080.1 Uncharacterised protein [Pseudomonas putida]